MKKKKKLKGVMVVEMACLSAFFVLMIATAVMLFFYYYDKNILQGAAFETAVFGAERYDKGNTEMLETYFKDRIEKKTIFFSNAQVKIVCEDDFLSVHASMSHGKVKVSARAGSAITRPEDVLREKKRWTKQLGKE